MQPNNQDQNQDFREEYLHIKSDVRRVIFINLLFVLILVGIYVADQKLGFLTKLEALF